MQAVMKGTVAPIVEIVDGIPTVLSTNVAAVFEKRNDNVIRDIEEILSTLPENRKDNFIETQIERPSNLGRGTVKSKAYRLTRDGFTFLVMGYTGEKAARFKWAYIDEFNRQQALLESQVLPPMQSERTLIAGDSLAENVLRGLSGQMDAENVGDKLVTIGTVLQVVGAIQKVPASGPQLQAALNAFQLALEKFCDTDELEKQRRRSLKARNAARARWDRIRQGGAE
ncbi:Rha family transcriptional regulator [Sutterella wadsworthensis]|jgi:phage regulatory protein, rha family|uniref:Rha family transcriptional regulator n=1 Tax=Sutterella wadsworthensis TaxID=40545 RepID=UPI0013F62737|nr:Rha family transcriptional regulator [Sutterella wadsworthensis]